MTVLVKGALVTVLVTVPVAVSVGVTKTVTVVVAGSVDVEVDVVESLVELVVTSEVVAELMLVSDVAVDKSDVVLVEAVVEAPVVESLEVVWVVADACYHRIAWSQPRPTKD